MKIKPRRLRQALTVAAAIVFAATGTAGAQDQSELSYGRTPGWSFTPGFTLAGVYDTNVALAAVDPRLQQSESDRLVIAEPSVQLDFLSKRTELSTGYQGYVRRYMDLNQLNGFDQHGHGSRGPPSHPGS